MKKLFIIIAVILFFGSIIKINASNNPGGDFTGWLWSGSYLNIGSLCGSSQTDCGNAGWGSLSSLNNYSGDTAPPPDYGIDFPAVSGAVNGRVWMSNLGWIDLNPAGPFPAGVCNPGPCPANGVIREANNDLSGWARIAKIGDASSFQVDPNNPSLVDNSGGYSGWIKMSGTASDGTNYKVYYDSSTDSLLGNAWSPDIGWITFDGRGPSVPPVFSDAELVSGAIDTCPSGIDCGASLNTILWRGSTNSGFISFQIASSNSLNGPWDFYGPNGIASDYYSAVVDTPVKITAEHLNKRYFKYKIFISDCSPNNCGGNPIVSPVIKDIILNWSE